MINHKKIEHTDNVNSCWNYSTGTCTYGEKDCWFIHKGKSSVPEFKCKICDEPFCNRLELQKHRKRRHPNTIQTCRNVLNGGKCIYDKHCLLKNVENEKNEVENVKKKGGNYDRLLRP